MRNNVLVIACVLGQVCFGVAGAMADDSAVAAASLHATLGDGDNAFAQIRRQLADGRFVQPNTWGGTSS